MSDYECFSPAGLNSQQRRRFLCSRRSLGVGMSATKILWRQILAVSFVAIGTIWGDPMGGLAAGLSASAWSALCRDRRSATVPPPAFFLWWYWFDAYAPGVFVEGAVIASSGVEGAVIALSGGFAVIAIAIDMSVWRSREAHEVVTYGSARWATLHEIRCAGC